MYADDTKIYRVVNNQVDQTDLQSDLNRVLVKLSMLKLTVNHNKCIKISFNKRDPTFPILYRIYGNPIQNSDIMRDLGLLFDFKLNFTAQLNYVIAKAAPIQGFIHRRKKELRSYNVVAILYGSLLRSIIEHCWIVWDRRSVGFIKLIEQIQRKYSRLSLNIPPDPRNPRYIPDISYTRSDCACWVGWLLNKDVLSTKLLVE